MRTARGKKSGVVCVFGFFYLIILSPQIIMDFFGGDLA